MAERRSGGRRSRASERARTGGRDPRGARAAPRPPVDREVRSLIAGGDVDGAATRIIREFGRAVLRHLASSLRDAGDAADAFSGFEEHVWTGIRRFRGDASLRTWVYRIARNAANDVRKSARRRHGRDTMAAPERATGEAAADWGTQREPGDALACLERLRADLSDEDRILLALRVDRELPWREVARALSPAGRRLDPTTVMKRFDRVAARLRRIAQQRGLL